MKVCLTKCDSYENSAVAGAVERALEPLGSMASVVRPGQRVLVKPNMLSASAIEKRVTTDPAMVREVCRLVLAAGGRPLIADSPALDSFDRVAKKSGIGQVAEELGVDLAPLGNSTRINLESAGAYQSLELAEQATRAEVVINLPKLKTHSLALMTLGVKNLFGTVVAQRKAEWHLMVGESRDNFAALLLAIHDAVRPALTILDGVWGMEGNGPGNGEPKHFGVVGASTNALALDLTVCRLLNIDLEALPLYRAARDQGRPEIDQDAVQVLGDGAGRLAGQAIILPETGSMSPLPGPLDWLARRYLVSRPAQSPALCQACGKCEEVCPPGCLTLDKVKATIDHDRCIRCYCCQEVCPAGAISFKTGLIAKFLKLLNR